MANQYDTDDEYVNADFIDITGEPQFLDWDAILHHKNKNINDKYILDGKDVRRILTSYVKRHMSIDDCKDFVNEYGIDKTIEIVKHQDNYEIKIDELKTKPLYYKYMSRHIYQYIIKNRDLIANTKNGGYLTIDDPNEGEASGDDTDNEYTELSIIKSRNMRNMYDDIDDYLVGKM